MYEEIRVCKLCCFFFFLEKRGVRINRAYELLEIQWYMNIILVSVYTVVWVPQVYSCAQIQPQEKGSGDIWLIPRALFTLTAFCQYFSEKFATTNHIAENTICS